MNANKFFALFIIISISVLSLQQVTAQISSGKMSIRDGGFISVFGTHNFSKGSGFIPGGKIKTERKGDKGYLNFTYGSTWLGASENGYVDGYVKVLHSNPFVFPVGDNNRFRPVAITGAMKTMVAYFAEDPSDKAANNPAPSPSSDIARVSNKEYWDIKGAFATTIALSWGAESNIANLTGGDLSKLKILGWKEGTYTVIPSTQEEVNYQLNLDQLSLTDANTFSKGIIATAKEIIPNDYDFFTLGSVSEGSDSRTIILDSDMIGLYPNPVQQTLYVNLDKLQKGNGYLKVYDINGKLVQEADYKEGDNTLQLFDVSKMSNGMYKIHVRINQQEYIGKFVVERLY